MQEAEYTNRELVEIAERATNPWVLLRAVQQAYRRCTSEGNDLAVILYDRLNHIGLFYGVETSDPVATWGRVLAKNY